MILIVWLVAYLLQTVHFVEPACTFTLPIEPAFFNAHLAILVATKIKLANLANHLACNVTTVTYANHVIQVYITIKPAFHHAQKVPYSFLIHLQHLVNNVQIIVSLAQLH